MICSAPTHAWIGASQTLFISITQLVDKCKSCILIGNATKGIIVIVIESRNSPVFLSFFSPNKYH